MEQYVKRCTLVVVVLAQPGGKTMALAKLISVIPKIPGYADKVVKITRELYKRRRAQFRRPTKEQLKLIREGKLKPRTFSEKRLEMELTNVFKGGGPKTTTVRLPTTSRADKLLKQRIEDGRPLAKSTTSKADDILKRRIEDGRPLAGKNGKARGGPVGYTQRWKTGRKG